MIKNYENIIKRFTKAKDIYEIDEIQSLWSGYGKIVRYGLTDCEFKTVVVKHVQLPKNNKHPRGWNSELSHKRKIKSYKVETAWYKKWNHLCNKSCYVPKSLGIEVQGNEVLIILEDLSDSGYSLVKNSITYDERNLCISWLANFHATFLGKEPEELWEVGTYWHIDTRPHELEAISDIELKKTAHKIDLALKRTKYKTFVHGDAKLANFCFKPEGKGVAAVDFQYVGGGCGMKDLAYFVGSCLGEEESESMEQSILDYYFTELKKALAKKEIEVNIDIEDLEKDWREIYPIAWADFHRFLKGWSPEHWKINSYSERVTRSVIEKLMND